MTPSFRPYRLDVAYYPCQEVPIATLFDQLELTRVKSWGMQLRRGLLELSPSDYETISNVMLGLS